MALPALDRPDCDGFAPDHSVEDHLESERIALAADLQAVEAKASGNDRWRLIRAAGLGIALAGTIAFGWSRLQPKPATPTSCPADGYVTGAGAELRRDAEQGCAWVDGNGEKVPVDAAGNPTG